MKVYCLRPTHRETANNGGGDENGEQILGMDIGQAHLREFFGEYSARPRMPQLGTSQLGITHHQIYLARPHR